MLTTIATFREPWEAHAFRSRLDAENIPAMVAFEHHVGVNWIQSTALGGVKVQVPEWFAQDAMLVEKRARDGVYRSELLSEFGDLDDPRCPFCGSLRFWRRCPYLLALVSVVVVFTMGAIVPPQTWICRCENCGRRFRLR